MPSVTRPDSIGSTNLELKTIMKTNHNARTSAGAALPLFATLFAMAQLTTVFAQEPVLISTFTNPTPAFNDQFGYSVAGVGNDLVVVGAWLDDAGANDAGAAYLFSANGTLLHTLTNPTPAAVDHFGFSVAGVGSDRLLMGARTDDTGANDAGAAYLFGTNGTLLTTFTNPSPVVNGRFGVSVAALGADRALIGAERANIGGVVAGAAYLFSLTGGLVATFTNPAAVLGDGFGTAVAAVGTDRVLIGAWGSDIGASDAGAAFLFSTNGTLLTTFTNPTPEVSDNFGLAVTGVGNDRVLVGAPADDSPGSDIGAAYLFSLDGTLLKTITNPTPEVGDRFGQSVAATPDRVLIGAWRDNTGAGDAGAAYVFDRDGQPLGTITNPAPVASDQFGYSVAVVGNDQFLVGTIGDDTGASAAGSADLFTLASTPTLPALTIVPGTPDEVMISWTPPTPGFVLQETWSLDPPDWTNSPSGATNPITVPTLEPMKFYRLYKP